LAREKSELYEWWTSRKPSAVKYSLRKKKSRAHLLIFACRNRDFLWSEGVAPAYKKYLVIINLVGAHGTKRKNKVSFCGEEYKGLSLYWKF
jgi:hypothetical protein